MEIEDIITILVFVISVFIGVFSFYKSRKLRIDLEKREEDTKRRMYELSILKELGDRIGYSLNVQNIIDIITGSLHQFIDYSVVSYMFLEPEKVIFKVHLEKSVSRKFVDEIKLRMLKSVSALSGVDFQKTRIEEILSGAVLAEEIDAPVNSFFNIPLVIAGKVVGVLTIADVESGLYKEEEMTILYKITQQASQAVTRLQEVVEIEQKKLNAMMESMSEGVVMTDLDYRILVVNPAAKQAVGLDGKKEITVFDFVDKLSGKFDFRGRIEESVKLDKVFISEEVQLNERFFQIIVSPVKSRTAGDKENILGSVTIFRDVTHEKEIEKMKEDFTSMIVHELRTPLDGVKKVIELIRTTKVKKEQQMNYFQMMYHSSSDMLELINNLLDVAKIESDKFKIVKQPASIKEAIENRVKMLEVAAKDAKVELVTRIGQDVPEKVNFDRNTISQVLNNLISNAIKFTKENGKIVVRVLLHKNGQDVIKEAGDKNVTWFLKDGIDYAKIPDSLFISVTDNGIGISPEAINELFIKFSQVRNMFTEKGGTGLGLAIVKSIVESHGGIVGVESVEGRGSTFYFTIPIT
ncbi:MAG: ATP-binding protein [Candidatus Staskawiczbacteria bacterium]|nr:ATP-binding protein [Candidatus Staskawiczbacteria bacterium]